MAEGFYQHDGSHLMKEIYDQFLICKICFEQFRNPKTLSCMHVFCCICLEKHQDAELERSYRYMLYSRAVSCPICRKKTELPPGGIRRLQESFLVSNLTEVVNRRKPHGDKIICEICTISTSSTRTPEAVSKCLECCKLLCFRCVRAHKRTKVTQSHSLYDINVEKDIECKVHEGEMIRYFCEQCEQCICVLCTFQEHKGHDITSFADGIQKYQLSMEMLVDQCKTKVVDIRHQLDIINKCEYELKSTEEQIRDQSLEAISTVRRLQNEFTQDLHSVYGDEAFAYLKRKVFLQDALETLLNACKLTDVVMDDKSIELLLFKKEMQDKLEVSLQQPIFRPPAQLMKEVRFNPQPFSFGYLDVLSEADNGEIEIERRVEPDIIQTTCQKPALKPVCATCNEESIDPVKTTTTQSTNTTPWHQLLNDIMTSAAISTPTETSPSPNISVSELHAQMSSRLSVSSFSSRSVSPSVFISDVNSPATLAIQTDDLPLPSSSSLRSNHSTSSSDTMYSLDQFTSTTPTVTCDRTTSTIQKYAREQSTDTIDLKGLNNKTTSTMDVKSANCGTTTDEVEQVNRSTCTPLPEMSDKITSTKKLIKTDQQTMTPLRPIMLDIGLSSKFLGEDKSVGTVTTVFCDTATGDNVASVCDQSTETAWNGMVVPSREQSTTTRVIVFSRSTSPPAVPERNSLLPKDEINTDNAVDGDDTLSVSSENINMSNSRSNINITSNTDFDSDDESAFTYTDDDSYMDDSDMYDSTMSLEMANFKCPYCKSGISGSNELVSNNNAADGGNLCTPYNFADKTSLVPTNESTGSCDSLTSIGKEYVPHKNVKPVLCHMATNTDNVNTAALDVNKVATDPTMSTDVGIWKRPETVSRGVSTVPKYYIDSYTFMPVKRTRNICTITEPVANTTSESGCNTDYITQVDKEIDVKPLVVSRETGMPRVISREVSTGTKPTSIRTRGCSPVRVPGVEASTITVPQKMHNKCLQTTRVLLHDMACGAIAFRGDDKEVMATVKMEDKQLDAFNLDTRDQAISTVQAKTYNSGTSMEPISYSTKETLTTKIHMMNKNTGTDNASMVDKQTTTTGTDVTAGYRGGMKTEEIKTITRGTSMMQPKYTTRHTSPIKEVPVLTDRASSPIKWRFRDKGTNVDKADFVDAEKFHMAGSVDDGQPIKRAPSLDTIREASQESSLDIDDEEDLDILHDQPVSVALSSAISSILTHIETFCATSYNKGDQCQSTFSSSTYDKPNNVSPILCRVEQGTSTQSVKTEDKAISTESFSVDGKMAECITKLKTVRQRLEQPTVTTHVGEAAFSPLYSKADTRGDQATIISSGAAPITASRTITSLASSAAPTSIPDKVEAFGDKLNQLSIPFMSHATLRKQMGASKSPLTSPRSKARKQRLDMSHMLCTGPNLNPMSSQMPLMTTKRPPGFGNPLHVKTHNLTKLNIKEAVPCISPRPSPKQRCTRNSIIHEHDPIESNMQRSCSDESLPKPNRYTLTRGSSSLDYVEYDDPTVSLEADYLKNNDLIGESISMNSLLEEEENISQ